jgi:hypothetical protein
LQIHAGREEGVVGFVAVGQRFPNQDRGL